MADAERASFMGVPMKHLALITVSMRRNTAGYGLMVCAVDVPKLGARTGMFWLARREIPVGRVLTRGVDTALFARDAAGGRAAVPDVDGGVPQ